jgi:hypothetical protein
MFKRLLHVFLLGGTVLSMAACLPALRQVDAGADPAREDSGTPPPALEALKESSRSPALTPASAPGGDRPIEEFLKGATSGSTMAGEERPEVSRRSKARRKATEEWEDDKVKGLARDMARRFPNVRKAKVCYDAKDDEWWVILYEDNDSFLELKQYIWNRDEDLMEPFLVQRRVPKSKLEEELASSPRERACEVLDGLAKE